MADLTIVAVLALLVLGCAAHAQGEAAPPTRAAQTLAEGGTLRVVGFGDSITGVYYHTGGVRAWPEMLGIALGRLYPDATVVAINAGVSGNTTAAGLARMDADVIAHDPDLVVVMFGMNDVARATPEEFRANLTTIVTRCREIGAEVVLCTPNSIYEGGRSMEGLAAFAQIVREVGAELGAPVADCYAAYEGLRAVSARAWRLLMSETIHPNLRGHKVFAEEIARTITARWVSVQDVAPAGPVIPHTRGRLERGEAVKVIAMEPALPVIEGALRRLRPDAQLEVIAWPTAGQSLAEIAAWGKGVREQAPDLVVVAVPADAAAEDEEQFIRSYSWVLSWSQAFGRRSWDTIVLMPSVLGPVEDGLGAALVTDLAREVIRGQDLPWLERAHGDQRPSDELIDAWLGATE